MKLLALIMSFLVLSLNSVPCCLLEECTEEVVVEKEAHKKKENCENCSPFINCGTCSGFLLSIEAYYLGSEVIESRLTFFQFQDLPLFRYIPAIWQPPQPV